MRTLRLPLLAMLAALALLLLAALTIAAPPDSPLRPTKASALGKVKCDKGLDGQERPGSADKTIVRALIDPIVRHNQAGAPHVHDFYGAGWVKTTGNPTWPVAIGNNANYADLTATISSCRVPQATPRPDRASPSSSSPPTTAASPDRPPTPAPSRCPPTHASSPRT